MNLTVMNARTQKLLATLIESGKPMERNSLYLKAGLWPPTNGSDELALRKTGKRGGIRTFCNVKIDGWLNPIASDGSAIKIFSGDLIEFVSVKNEYELDLSLANTQQNELEETASMKTSSLSDTDIEDLRKLASTLTLKLSKV